jgi:drug/metabolite transporter (DMT)-like permease
MFIFNLGTVLIRRHYGKVSIEHNPLVISVGGFILASFILGIIQLLKQNYLPKTLSFSLMAQSTTVWIDYAAIAYLALVGSLIGFGCYNYVSLKKSVLTASIVNMITPALALLLGAMVLNEQLRKWELTGAFIVIISVCLYFGYEFYHTRITRPLRSFRRGGK